MSDAPAHLPRAREAALAAYAHRAVDDPVALAKAARIVRAALARQAISLDELTPLSDTRRARPETEAAA